jgi:DNA helicase-2/ATP-dependent DNA helicase PcrA
MTRAMKKLYISFAQARMLWGSLRFNQPSLFIDEIPEDFYALIPYKNLHVSKLKKKSSNEFDFSDEFSQVSSFETEGESTFVVSTPKIDYTFPLGSKVRHKLYGDGIVKEVDGFGKDEKIVILFKGGTRKKFLVKFAPIEIV